MSGPGWRRGSLPLAGSDRNMVWPFPPEDRRLFCRPWFALPGLVVVFLIGMPTLILWRSLLAWWAIPLWHWVFEVSDMGLPTEDIGGEGVVVPETWKG